MCPRLDFPPGGLEPLILRDKSQRRDELLAHSRAIPMKKPRRYFAEALGCARDWTRTSTVLLPLAPETSASTNSATRALFEMASPFGKVRQAIARTECKGNESEYFPQRIGKFFPAAPSRCPMRSQLRRSVDQMRRSLKERCRLKAIQAT